MADSQNRVIDLILRRRSIRFNFDRRAVPSACLEQIVACGLAAPSSKNAQPWRFHVMSDPAMLRRLAELVSAAPDIDDYVPHDPRTGEPRERYRSTVRESATVLLDAPTAILVENLGAFSGCRRALVATPQEALASVLEGYSFEMIGIGAAVENMWIAATALGLAAAFLGDIVAAEERIRAELDLRGDLAGVLVIGYSTAQPPPPMDSRAFEDTARVVWHRPLARPGV